MKIQIVLLTLLALPFSALAGSHARWQKALDQLTQHVAFEGPIRKQWMVGTIHVKSSREVLYWDCDNCGLRVVRRGVQTFSQETIGDINLGSPVRLRPLQITDVKGDQLVIGMPRLDTGRVIFAEMVAYCPAEVLEAIVEDLARATTQQDPRKEGPAIEALVKLTEALAPVVVANGVNTFLIHQKDGIEFDEWRWQSFKKEKSRYSDVDGATRFPKILERRVTIEATIPLIGMQGQPPVLPLDQTSRLYLPAELEQGVLRHLALQEELLQRPCNEIFIMDGRPTTSPIAQALSLRRQPL